MSTRSFHASEKAVEVVSWDPVDHTDLPGFAHGLTRYGSHWMDVGISVIPVGVDALEALEAVFARLREVVATETPDVEYFTVDLRVASRTAPRRPDVRDRAALPAGD
ncbi:hypothetical protein [Mycobacterium sp. 3519A]|uniref:hypothetical protein n=1 Tax=Mycobacterium sp. 3519A TaxID=2057184 RepID=UPI001159B9E3|nr:hypothetical protein [Mycobacterium sp. 3519A]